MKIDGRVMKAINRDILRETGMSYEEFDELDYQEQQKIFGECRAKKNKYSKNEMVRVMIGSGEHAIFTYVKKGTKVMLADGTIVEAGINPEEERERMNKEFDRITRESFNIKKKVLGLFKRRG